MAIAGVALINAGLGRSRSAAQAMLGNLALVAVSAIVFAFVGASFTGSLGTTEVILHAAGKGWSVLGLGPFLLHRLGASSPQAQLAVLFEFLAVAMLVQLPWGSGADRWRLAAGCASAVVLAAIVFPLAAHWIWAGGWLAALGANFSAGAGFIDAGGAATVHVIGGLSALAMVWIAGPRRGKFPKEGLSTAMPGHNAIYVLFGCLLALVGWLAWNLAGAIVWIHAPLAALPGTAINTLLTASGALAATFSVTRFRFGKPDASLCANGWLAGLVASSASAAFASPVGSLFIGAVAGVFTPLLVEVLELALSVDDPTGAITVHGAAGLWGLIAAGFFAPQAGQLLAQLIGIAALLGFIFPLIYLLFAVLNRFIPFRVDPDGERMGMDLHEIGGGAYPEFVIHRDESYR
jgi:Amt family ammonium transporter